MDQDIDKTPDDPRFMHMFVIQELPDLFIHQGKLPLHTHIERECVRLILFKKQKSGQIEDISLVVQKELTGKKHDIHQRILLSSLKPADDVGSDAKNAGAGQEPAVKARMQHEIPFPKKCHAIRFRPEGFQIVEIESFHPHKKVLLRHCRLAEQPLQAIDAVLGYGLHQAFLEQQISEFPTKGAAKSTIKIALPGGHLQCNQAGFSRSAKVGNAYFPRFKRTSMKTKRPKKILAILSASLLLAVGADTPGSAQQLSITLQEAIEKARTRNKSVAASKQQEAASAADYRDARNAILPQWSFGAEYDRFSKLTMFENGLSEAHSMTRRPSPNAVNAGTRVEFTLYSGGRQRASIEEQLIKTRLERINTSDLEGNVALQVVIQYMEMVRLQKLDSLIGEQVRRAEIRLKNIQSMYNNQRVTKSDLLRAEVILSGNKLNREQAGNDLAIANRRLNVLLNLPDTTILLPQNPADLPEGRAYASDSMLNQPNHSYLLQRSAQNIRLQESRITLIKSSYYPTVQLVGAYGLNYPNTLFFPPVAQWYSVGFVGIKTGINISSFYHSKQKMTAARARLAGMYLQQQSVADQVDTEIRAAQIKYGESLSRIRVAEQSIEQTSANLKITNTKYLNQLALLTDLLDADNLFLESNYNLVKARADERIYYYKLLYTQGLL